MSVNKTTVKISAGLDDIEANELLVRPNPFSGKGHGADEVVLTIRKKVDDDGDFNGRADGDTPVHIAVDVNELRNAIDLVQLSHYDMPDSVEENS